jgi:hypothetical protein
MSFFLLMLLFIRHTNHDYMISSDSGEGTASKKWRGGVEGGKRTREANIGRKRYQWCV